MAIAIRRNRRIDKGRSAEINYIIIGATSEVDARITMESQHVADGRPGINLGGISGINIKSISYRPYVERIRGSSVYNGRITYAYINTTQFTDTDPSTGADNIPGTWSFSTTGGRRRITQSIATYADPSAPNLNGAIDFDGQNVRGVDIVEPDLKIRVTKVYEPSEFTLADSQTVAYYTGKVNSAGFQGFAAGEVLYLGASGSQQVGQASQRNWSLTHEFAVKQNVLNPTVGGLTVTGTMDGWFYNWLMYQPDETDSLKMPKPVALFFEQVYKTIDLNNLPGF